MAEGLVNDIIVKTSIWIIQHIKRHSETIQDMHGFTRRLPRGKRRTGKRLVLCAFSQVVLYDKFHAEAALGGFFHYLLAQFS